MSAGAIPEGIGGAEDLVGGREVESSAQAHQETIVYGFGVCHDASVADFGRRRFEAGHVVRVLRGHGAETPRELASVVTGSWTTCASAGLTELSADSRTA